MSSPTQPAINWPADYLPGTTDNFVSNEVIAKGITGAEIWSLLADVTKWESYYKNCASVTPPASASTLLQKGDVFTFATFGFPTMKATVEESTGPPEPRAGKEGRLAWSVDQGGLQVYHAWLVQDLDGGRVRVLTQESQIGLPFVVMRKSKPNKMLLGHQDWLDGLLKAARGQKVAETNLGSVGAWERRS